MHELGTVFYVIREVEQVVEENHLTKVASVTLEIGEKCCLTAILYRQHFYSAISKLHRRYRLREIPQIENLSADGYPLLNNQFFNRHIFLFVNVKSFKHRLIHIHQGKNQVIDRRIICQTLIFLGRT